MIIIIIIIIIITVIIIFFTIGSLLLFSSASPHFMQVRSDHAEAVRQQWQGHCDGIAERLTTAVAALDNLSTTEQTALADRAGQHQAAPGATQPLAAALSSLATQVCYTWELNPSPNNLTCQLFILQGSKDSQTTTIQSPKPWAI